MQTDMHFFGTYVLARAAGIPWRDAHTIAYAAQFVDDSTRHDSTEHEDGGLLYGIATAHHDVQCVVNSKIEPEEQRRVWVPFHFLPGGEGESLEERLLCVKDSPIAREMIEHHVSAARSRQFGRELLGIAAHVYMDTFSHYGFSGIGSEYNSVLSDSFELIGVRNKEMERYVEGKLGTFLEKFRLEEFASFLTEKATDALGHGGVATYPDRPFLHWRVTFERPRPGNGVVSDRDNPATYLEGCEKIHGYFSRFARDFYTDSEQRSFDEFADQIDEILRFEGRMEERIEQWNSAFAENTIYRRAADEPPPTYSSEDWEGEKNRFHTLASSRDGIDSPVYRFHQAAALHRYYVLKDLLPAHNIAVY